MKNLLIVDSNKLVTKSLENKIKGSDFNIFIAESKKEAIELIEYEFTDFFVAVVDIYLPDAENGEIVDYMLNHNIPTIVLSANDDDDVIEKFTKKHIIDYITKHREEDLNYTLETIHRLVTYKDRKVLVVDDSKMAQIMIKKNLETLMFKVILADDGVQGLKILEKHKDIKLVLTDYNMPNMDGFELTLTLRKKFSKDELIIIAITASEDSKTTSKFLKFGANGYVSKQCTKEELNYTINNLMDILEKKEIADNANLKLQSFSEQLSKYLSPQIYKSILKGKHGSSINSKRKKLSIFFSDIASFTATTENLESEELTEQLNTYLTDMSDIALKYGATIDKFIGDAVMIFFGDPESQGVQQDALNCVKMAIEMQNQMEIFREKQNAKGVLNPFHIRCGIATGFVTVGNFGSMDRMDYTIIGGYVNLASRLESAATKDEVLISEETYILVKKYIKADAKEKITVKGFSKPIQTYQVLREKTDIEYSDEVNLQLEAILNGIDRSKVVLQETNQTKISEMLDKELILRDKFNVHR